MTLEPIYSDTIKAIFFKTLRAITAGARALKAAIIAVYTKALKTAAAIYTRALKATTAVITAITITRVTRLCLGLLQPSGVLIVPHLQFSG